LGPEVEHCPSTSSGAWARSALHPNPHCFIAITKATACGWKEPLLPNPLYSPVRGRGKGGLALRPWRFA
jgi:hypothetical protein